MSIKNLELSNLCLFRKHARLCNTTNTSTQRLINNHTSSAALLIYQPSSHPTHHPLTIKPKAPDVWHTGQIEYWLRCLRSIFSRGWNLPLAIGGGVTITMIVSPGWARGWGRLCTARTGTRVAEGRSGDKLVLEAVYNCYSDRTLTQVCYEVGIVQGLI